jgi:hypothetical protein
VRLLPVASRPARAGLSEVNGLAARSAAVAVLVASLSAALPWVWMNLGGRVGLALVLPLGIAFAVISVRTLMPATLILVVLAAEALGIFGGQAGEDLPFVQVMAGVRVTIRDALLVGALLCALARLARRREVPVFAGPFIAVLFAITVAFLLGVVRDGDVKAPLQALRPLFGYSLYVIIVGAVDSRRKFVWLLATIFGVAVLAVAIQVAEAVGGQPLPFLALPLAAGQAQAGLAVNGRLVPYIWSHAPWHSFLALLLALGCLFEWRSPAAHAGLALVGAVGFAIQLVRSWYIFIGVGMLVMLVLQPNWTRRLRILLVVAGGTVLLGTFAVLTANFTAQSYGSLLDVWLQRSGTLLSFQQDSSYQARVGELAQQWRAVLDAPLLGYGFSADGLYYTLTVGNLDTGAVNTLVVFGVVGTATFVGLVLRAVWLGLRLIHRLPPSWERGYAFGVVGIWAAVLVGYAFNYDFLTHPHGPWLVVLTLAVQDRLQRLAVSGTEASGASCATLACSPPRTQATPRHTLPAQPHRRATES